MLPKLAPPYKLSRASGFVRVVAKKKKKNPRKPKNIWTNASRWNFCFSSFDMFLYFFMVHDAEGEEVSVFADGEQISIISRYHDLVYRPCGVVMHWKSPIVVKCVQVAVLNRCHTNSTIFHSHE